MSTTPINTYQNQTMSNEPPPAPRKQERTISSYEGSPIPPPFSIQLAPTTQVELTEEKVEKTASSVLNS